MTWLDLPLLNAQAQYILNGRQIPPQFPYLSVLLQGRPKHRADEFAFRHPQMEREKRAKLFAPFDALDGYNENIVSKHVLYTDKVIQDEEDKEELNRRLTILRRLTMNSRAAKANRPHVTVVYYVPCADENSFAFGAQGQYVSVCGVVQKVDFEIKQTLTVEHIAIPLEDILSISPDTEDLFAEPR